MDQWTARQGPITQPPRLIMTAMRPYCRHRFVPWTASSSACRTQSFAHDHTHTEPIEFWSNTAAALAKPQSSCRACRERETGALVAGSRLQGQRVSEIRKCGSGRLPPPGPATGKFGDTCMAVSRVVVLRSRRRRREPVTVPDCCRVPGWIATSSWLVVHAATVSWIRRGIEKAAS